MGEWANGRMGEWANGRMGEWAKVERKSRLAVVVTSLASIILENDDVLDVASRTHGSNPAIAIDRNAAS
jgi:hypothetical protein